ncbi:snaclec 8-like [Asterias rubens]|uniref:snaclec 8-like n=1 Tax=Asterias rubens TaxID=7604 RepID=UPI001455A762|nr:snaclec 8-like [Asterias rubens]
MAGKKLVFVAVLLCIGMRCEARCTAGECPLQGWVKFGSNSCIKMYPTLMKNWAEAEAICRVIGRGSHLVRINSDEESLAIKRELDSLGLQTRYLWIGLNDIEQELNRTWVGHKYEQNMYQSIDSWFQEISLSWTWG